MEYKLVSHEGLVKEWKELLLGSTPNIPGKHRFKLNGFGAYEIEQELLESSGREVVLKVKFLGTIAPPLTFVFDETELVEQSFNTEQVLKVHLGEPLEAVKNRLRLTEEII